MRLRRQRRGSGLVRLGLSVGVSLAGALAFMTVGGGIQAASAYVAPGACTAGFVDQHPDSQTSVIYAYPSAGCTGQDYRFSIWSTQSDVYATSFPQVMIASTTSAPWTLTFTPSASPTCYFQVDFGYLHSRTGPGGKTWQYTPLSALMGVIPGCTPGH